MNENARAEHYRALSARNNALVYAETSRAMERRQHEWDDVWAADSGAPSSHTNSATLKRPLREDDAGDLVERVASFYAGGTGGSWHFWSAWPTPDLTVHGLTMLGDPPLMGREGGAHPVEVPPELTIAEVLDGAALRDWVRVFVDGFPVIEEQGAPDLMLDDRVLGGAIRFFAGYVEGGPVTCAAASVDDAIVGVHFVATLPHARRRGYGAAITQAAAKARPDLPAWLVSSRAGRHVYEEVGFVEVSQYVLWKGSRLR